jgi:endonuclease V-like protein UPF0215 family
MIKNITRNIDNEIMVSIQKIENKVKIPVPYFIHQSSKFKSINDRLRTAYHEACETEFLSRAGPVENDKREKALKNGNQVFSELDDNKIKL